MPSERTLYQRDPLTVTDSQIRIGAQVIAARSVQSVEPTFDEQRSANSWVGLVIFAGVVVLAIVALAAAGIALDGESNRPSERIIAALVSVGIVVACCLMVRFAIRLRSEALRTVFPAIITTGAGQQRVEFQTQEECRLFCAAIAEAMRVQGQTTVNQLNVFPPGSGPATTAERLRER